MPKKPSTVVRFSVDHNAERLAFRLLKSMCDPASTRLYLIAGDPGTGKTSFVKAFSHVFGCNLLVIEAPHIVPEKLVLIPYFKVIQGKTTSKKTATDVEVRYAKPQILADIKELERRTPENWTKKDALKVAARYGGKWKNIVKKYWPIAEKARKVVKVILFIDEFYRTTNDRILSALRNLAINRSLGGSKLPLSVYLILASNLEDEGVDEIPGNHTFAKIYFEYSPEELKGYWVNELGIPEQLANKVLQAVTDEKGDLLLGKDGELYYSRRRLTNLVRLAAAATTPEEKRVVATLLKWHFKDPQAPELGEHRVANAVRTVITEEVLGSEITPYSEEQWPEFSRVYIQLVHKLPKYEKDPDTGNIVISNPYDHVLNIVSLPGVGKTTMLQRIAEELGAKVAEVDVSNLNVDDTVGVLRVVDGKTTFERPLLFDTIQEQLGFTEKDLYPDSITPGKPRYILFLDEITRPLDPRILNFLRLVMKDKRINEDPRTQLPADVVVVTAMNPQDVGTIDIPQHMKDILDFIPGEPSASSLFSYLNRKVAESVDPTYHPVVSAFYEMLDTYSAGVNNQGETVPPSQRIFWLGGAVREGEDLGVVWLPPREIEARIIDAALAISYLPTMVDVPAEDPRFEEAIKNEFMKTVVPDIATGLAATLAVDPAVQEKWAEIFTSYLTAHADDFLAPIFELRRATSAYTLSEVYEGDGKWNALRLEEWVVDIDENKAAAQFQDLLDHLGKTATWPELGKKVAEAVMSFNKIVSELDVPSDQKAFLANVAQQFAIAADMWVADRYYKIECSIKEPKKAYDLRKQAEALLPKGYASYIKETRAADRYIDSLRSKVLECAVKEQPYKGCVPDIKALVALLFRPSVVEVVLEDPQMFDKVEEALKSQLGGK